MKIEDLVKVDIVLTKVPTHLPDVRCHLCGCACEEIFFVTDGLLKSEFKCTNEYCMAPNPV
jgi:hypothetical protein